MLIVEQLLAPNHLVLSKNVWLQTMEILIFFQYNYYEIIKKTYPFLT